MSQRRTDAVRVGLLVVAALGHGVWLASLAANWGQPELLRRDFIVLHHAAHAAPEALYLPRAFPFLHPPPVAALARLLTSLPPLALYGVVLALDLAALAGLLVGLDRLEPVRAGRDLPALLVLASAPWWIQLVLGQPAVVWPMLWVLGAALAGRRPLLAGLVWALTGLKPIFLVGAAVLAGLRGRRSVAGVVVGLTALWVVSLPLGLGVWADWGRALVRGASGVAQTGAPLFKQHTVSATLLWLGVPGARWVAGLVAIGVGGATLHRLVLHRDDPSYVLSLLALATVAVSPYLYFYDALLLVIPAARLVARGRMSPSAWVASALFVVQPWVYFGLQAGSPFGALTLAWWAAEWRDSPGDPRV